MNASGQTLREYERARDDLAALMSALEGELDGEARDAVERARARLSRSAFTLAVAGEFSSGKSFLLNALLEKVRYGTGDRIEGLLATDVNPSTAAIVELQYGEREEATAIYSSGREERIPFDALGRFVAVADASEGGLHDAAQGDATAPEIVRVRTDSRFLQRGFTVVDTPGLASINPAHRHATLRFLPSADAVLYLVDTQQPLGEGDAAFLAIVRRFVATPFVVQTKIDLWREPDAGGTPAWEHAYRRIAGLAASFAPGAPVFAVSAREYAAGLLESNAAAMARSGMPQLLAALDTSLVRHTGHQRLTRAAEAAAAGARTALAAIDRDAAALAVDRAELQRRRQDTLAERHAMEERARAVAAGTVRAGAERAADVERSAVQLGQRSERALAQAFDIADVARLRDRERLHALVDRTIDACVREFAAGAAAATVADLEAALDAAPAIVEWSPDDAATIAGRIELAALDGPATSVAAAIAARFAALPAGGYMKRELIADVRSDVFPRLRDEVSTFGKQTANALRSAYDDLAFAIRASADRRSAADLDSIDRALAISGASEAADASQRLANRRIAIEAAAARVAERAAAFAPPDEDVRVPTVAATVRPPSAEPLDPDSYGRGLRPERWRVAVLGGLRRGKSRLIDALAGMPVLRDDVAGSARFPIHVRYGEPQRAYALQDDGSWLTIPFEEIAGASQRRTILALVPWRLPHELVLVHAPAFDSGDPDAEDAVATVASRASELLCVFSRQLSDRELRVYGRAAGFGRPMLFAHTMADHESPSERRRVVELASSYLARQGVRPERTFTVSSTEYESSRRRGVAAAGWNELPALRATIEAHAQSHMDRLDARERARTQRARNDAEPQQEGLLARWLRKGRRR